MASYSPSDYIDKPLPVLDTQAMAAGGHKESAGVNLKGYRWGLFTFVATGMDAACVITCKLEVSLDAGATWTDLHTHLNLETQADTEAALSGADGPRGQKHFMIDTQLLPRTTNLDLRCVMDETGGGTGVITLNAERHQPDDNVIYPTLTPDVAVTLGTPAGVV